MLPITLADDLDRIDLRTFREDLRPSCPLSEVERETGIDRSSLSRMERGLQWVSPEQLLRLSEFFGRRAGVGLRPEQLAGMLLRAREVSPSPDPQEGRS